MTKKDNPIASALFVIGILAIISGIIGGLYYGASDEFYLLGGMQSIVGWTVFVSGVIWGIVFFGFSEIIKLLQGIFNQRERLVERNGEGIKGEAKQNIESVSKSVVTNQVKEEIIEFYQSKGLNVTNIEETDKEDYFSVTLGNGRSEIVELGGFKPRIVTEE